MAVVLLERITFGFVTMVWQLFGHLAFHFSLYFDTNWLNLSALVWGRHVNFFHSITQVIGRRVLGQNFRTESIVKLLYSFLWFLARHYGNVQEVLQWLKSIVWINGLTEFFGHCLAKDIKKNSEKVLTQQYNSNSTARELVIKIVRVFFLALQFPLPFVQIFFSFLGPYVLFCARSPFDSGKLKNMPVS